ncbi:hypothetical protein BGX26_002837 [Mortierella sp. AD094]|nr:hypothetical protein BGX26_002837 [Mortierella sp. AD094]
MSLHSCAGSTVASNIAPIAEGTPSDNNTSFISGHGPMLETIVQDLELATEGPELSDITIQRRHSLKSDNQQRTSSLLTHTSTLAPVCSNQVNTEGKNHEAVIFIPDDAPTTPTISFAPSPKTWGHVSTDYDARQQASWEVSGQSSLANRNSRQEPTAYRRLTKDSNKTLTNIPGDISNQRKQLREFTEYSVDANSQATVTRRSPDKTKFDMSSQPFGVHHFKILTNGTGDLEAKKPQEPNLLRKLAPIPPTEGFSPAGKRYHDPRQSKKANKAAFKTTVTLFSNERTFNHWIKFAMLLGSLAMTLLNFSGDDVFGEVDLDGDDGDDGGDDEIEYPSTSSAAPTTDPIFDKTDDLPSEESMDKSTFSKSEETFIVIAEPGNSSESLARKINDNESPESS